MAKTMNLRCLHHSIRLAATTVTASLCAEVDLSSELRYRATLFQDYGLYELNRMGTNKSETEHEFRADLAIEQTWHKLQLRLGRRILDANEFKRPPEEDVHRIHQAYLDFSLPASDSLRVRLGRQEFSYNRGILIDEDNWDMEGNSFDALKLYLDGSAWDIDLLYGHLAKDHHNRLAGINIERTTPRRTINEFYLWYFGIGDEQDTLLLTGNPKNNPELDVFNLGTRMEGKLSRPLFYHWMANYQTGRMNGPATKDLHAYNLLGNLDYFVAHPVIRNIGIEYSLSSGDDGKTEGRHETFIPPFADRHVRSGAMDWMSMMNSEILTLYFFADVHPKVEALIEFHKFFMQRRNSTWYLADLSPGWWSPEGGWWSGHDWPGVKSPEKDVGSEIDLHLKFGKKPNRSFTAGYSIFFPGKMLRNWKWPQHGWGRNDRSQWAYVQTEFKF